MNRRQFVCSVSVLAVPLRTANAQQTLPAQVHVIGSLALGSTRSNDPIYEEIRKGLRDLGYVEGRDFRIEHRTAEDHRELLPRLAAELVGLKVDLIVTGNDESTRAARQATTSIPIIALLYNHDPVAAGFIGSFNHPGGNITGVTIRNSQLAGKRLELLKEMLPTLTRAAVFWDMPGQSELEVLRNSARSIDVHLQPIELKPPYDFNAMFKLAKAQKAEAVVILHAPQFYVGRWRLGALALKNKMPTSAVFRDTTESGGLMSYSTDVRDEYYRGAYFIDRVLKGAPAADIPFEETTNVKLVVNLKTAKALGITIPESILLRADEVIR